MVVQSFVVVFLEEVGYKPSSLTCFHFYPSVGIIREKHHDVNRLGMLKWYFLIIAIVILYLFVYY